MVPRDPVSLDRERFSRQSPREEPQVAGGDCLPTPEDGAPNRSPAPGELKGHGTVDPRGGDSGHPCCVWSPTRAFIQQTSPATASVPECLHGSVLSQGCWDRRPQTGAGLRTKELYSLAVPWPGRLKPRCQQGPHARQKHEGENPARLWLTLAVSIPGGQHSRLCLGLHVAFSSVCVSPPVS